MRGINVLSDETSNIFMYSGPSLHMRTPYESKTIMTMNDNDNDTLREVQHLSDEGLALQARVMGS